MQLEARPQTMLKSKVSTEQKVVTALQALNTKLASIATKAADLAKATAWGATKATSSNDEVTVTVDSSAATGSLTFSVVSTASASRVMYANAHEASTQGASGSTLTITYDDPSRTGLSLTLTDSSLEGVASAINGSDAGLTAALVRAGGTDAAPTYRLQVASTTTGELTGFTIDDGSGNFGGGVSSQVLGTNAKLLLPGQDPAAPLEFSSNTITDLMPGVDVTLLAGATGSTTITVERDVAKLTESVKAMVDSVNAALSEIGTLTAYDAATKKAGLLGGDSTLRSVRNQLIESVSRGLGGESLAAVGIEVDRYGKLTFDEAKFESAYAADPAKTVAQFAGTDQTPVNDKDPYDVAYGLADRLKVLGEAFSKSTDGTITKAIQSRQSAIKGMEDDIADWDIRLETRRTTLQRQYTALETALGKLQSQGNWLAGQLASLPTMSSGM
jgi:flagellar hook-associated protein 2